MTAARSGSRSAPANNEYALAALATARARGQRSGQERWVLPESVPGGPCVIVRRGDVIVEASVVYPGRARDVPRTALLSATAGLAPVTLRTVMSIWRKANHVKPIFSRA